ncbi:hypothetical protein [Mangrovicoccus sp. HB161399]|uniref:hypothetical protein n=1 Tax=Mangrovicoccus sp. HB161399 TaxID=2720392 RepID=UPI0015532E50|nr:hypothetical protein [Mangrovicoccus sp. HB161399]
MINVFKGTIAREVASAALSRAVVKWRIISDGPAWAFAMASAGPFITDRAALQAPGQSDSPWRLRSCRFGRLTPSTV